jgi:hypothetical protein
MAFEQNSFFVFIRQCPCAATIASSGLNGGAASDPSPPEALVNGHTARTEKFAYSPNTCCNSVLASAKSPRNVGF